jgi:hypothetical protein
MDVVTQLFPDKELFNKPPQSRAYDHGLLLPSMSESFQCWSDALSDEEMLDPPEHPSRMHNPALPEAYSNKY